MLLMKRQHSYHPMKLITAPILWFAFARVTRYLLFTYIGNAGILSKKVNLSLRAESKFSYYQSQFENFAWNLFRQNKIEAFLASQKSVSRRFYVYDEI